MLDLFRYITSPRLFIAAALMLSPLSALAEGNARENYETTVSTYTIPATGQLAELRRFNYVDAADSCFDFGLGGGFGIFPVTYARQGYRLYVAGSMVAESPLREQRDNYEHCPLYAWNVETCSQIVQNFYVLDGQLRVRIRQHGGWCQQNSCGNCPIVTHDEVIVLSYALPAGPQACAPGSGPCCDAGGNFRPPDWVCAAPSQWEACGTGRCTGQHTRTTARFCSGASAACDGTTTFGPWGACSGGQPEPEVCNGFDDNCNGVADETNGSSCMDYSTCSMVPRNVCDPLCDAPPVDVCDGRDNDCDGQIDEPFHGYLGQTCGQGLGACHSQGVYVCAENGGVTCSAPILPPDAEETCGDNIDNNCNGLTDETPCSCVDGTVQECGPPTEVGQCRRGTQTCVNGRFSSCADAIFPGTETCNGLDDDCDGYSDEFQPRNCYESNAESCELQGWTHSENIPNFPNHHRACCGNDPAEEAPWGEEDIGGQSTCNDNRDNDCDSADSWPPLIDEHPCPVSCPNGLQQGQCDGVQPFMCIYSGDPLSGEYQARCDVCGCPAGSICHSSGECFPEAEFPIEILNFAVEPNPLAAGVPVHFTLTLHPSSTPFVNIVSFRIMDHWPTQEELQNGFYNPLPVFLFDDGLHNDGAAGDLVYGGSYSTGFTQGGYYAFEVSSWDSFFNIDEAYAVVEVPAVAGPACEALFESGSPLEKMNFYFVPHGSGPDDPIGYHDGNLNDFEEFVADSWDHLLSWGVSSEYSDRFNAYRINYPADLGCEEFDTTCADGNPCTKVECSNQLAIAHAIANCGVFKQSGGARSDKIAIIPRATFRSYAYAAGTTTHISPSSRVDTLAHETGHLWGVLDYYFYINQDFAPVSLNCADNELRECGMCSPWTAPHFNCRLNWRVSCMNRADVDDELIPFCLDSFSDDEDYLRNLLEGLP